MKIIIFITIIFCQNFVFAFGNPERTKKCELMSIGSEQIRITNDGKGCLFYKKNSQKIFADIPQCPKLFKNKYVYIWSNLEKLETDYMEITSSKHCDQKLYWNLDTYILGYGKNDTEKLLNDNVKEKDPLSKITKLHFFRIRSQDKIWTYHYSPGVSVDIEVTGEMCDGKLCMDEKKQKFSKVLKTYIDFIWMDDNDEVYYSSALDPAVKQPRK
jgi:hypothetical protein